MDGSKREEFVKGLKVSEEEKNAFLSNAKYSAPNDMESKNLYNKYVQSQQPYFEEYIKYLNEVLCILKDYSVVSAYTQFIARIKSAASAIKNDDIKAVNDVFGIEVDFATEQEQKFVQEIIKSTLSHKTRENNHAKKTGYKAIHYSGYSECDTSIKKNEDSLVVQKLEELLDDESCIYNISKKHLKSLKEELAKAEKTYNQNINILLKSRNESKENLPIVEGHFLTIETAIKSNIGDASHMSYKGEKIEDIQKKFDDDKFDSDEIPIMWESYLKRDENCEIMPPKILSRNKTLKRLYPTLITIDKIRKEKQIR